LNWALAHDFQAMAQHTENNRLQNIDLPTWVNWRAQDADGTWWGFEAEPHPHHQGWYENEVGRCLRLQTGTANPDWLHTLTRVQQAASATTTD
jgi:hypothetical protein